MNIIKKIANIPFIKKYISEAPISEMSFWSSPYYAPSQLKPYNPDGLVRKKGGLDVYRNMMVDDQVKAVMAMKVNAVLSPGWKIESASEDEGDVEISKFIEHCLDDGMKGDFKKNLTNILSALIYGYSVTEKVYQKFEKGEYAGKVGLKCLKTRPAHSFYLHTDEYNNLVKIEQLTNLSGSIYFEGDKLKYFIVYSFHSDNSDFDNWYGVSDLRAAYRPWFAKDMIIRFLNIYSERFGMGVVHGKYARGLGKKEITDLQNMIDGISAKTSFLTPDSVNFEILEGKRSGQAQFIDTIKMYDTAIARSVLVPNMLGFTDNATGTYNLGEKHFDLFMMILENIQSDIEGVINEQIVRELVDYNFADVEKYPEFKFQPLTQEDRQELAKIFITAFEKGTVIATEDDEAYLRESLNFPSRKKEAVILPEKKVANPFGVPSQQAPAEDPEKGMKPKDKPGEKAPASQKEEKPDDEEIEAEKFQLKRKLTDIEKKVNFEKVTKFLDGREYEVALELGKLITKMKDELVSTVIRRKIIEDKDYKEVDKLDLKYLGDLRLLWKDVLRKAFVDGKNQAREMLPKSYAKAPSIGNLPPKEALAFFERKAFWLTGTERDYILNKIKPLLYDGIKSGLTTEDVVYNLEEFFSKYEVIQRDSQGNLKPVEEIEGRINTIVRTNYMDAYNQGSLTMFQDASSIIAAYEYSAIMDGRTTDICSELDGKIYKTNNPIWVKITPPNHFQCRSILIPVFNDEWDGQEDALPTVQREAGFGG